MYPPPPRHPSQHVLSTQAGRKQGGHNGRQERDGERQREKMQTRDGGISGRNVMSDEASEEKKCRRLVGSKNGRGF